MFARVTVPILPHVRVTGASPTLRDGVLTRAQESIGAVSGAKVTVYNAQGDGSAAVSEAGVVDSRATKAYVYRNWDGSGILDNPITLDDFGGPDDTARTADAGVAFSFRGFPGIYHLLVEMPNGKRFGIPYVRVPFDPLSWFPVNISELYNDTDTGATALNSLSKNKQDGTDLAPDTNVARVIAQKSTVGVANTSCWQGEEPWANSLEHGFAADSADPLADGNGRGVFGRPMIIQASQYVDIAQNVSATMKSGIAMGFATNGSPNASDFPANPTKPLLALYSEWATRTYVLYLARGAGSGNTASQTLTALGFTAADPNGLQGAMDRLQIRFNPNAKVVEGWVNGWFGGRITTAAAFPPVSSNIQEGFNCFAISGATTGANISAAWWNCRYYVGMPQ